MTPIEMIALFVVLFAAVKLVVILIKPRYWLCFVKKIYENSRTTTLISFILGMIILILLIREGITIVHIFATMLFFMCLMAISLAAFPKEMLELGNRLLRDKRIVKKAWLGIVIWAILVVWLLFVIFY